MLVGGNEENLPSVSIQKTLVNGYATSLPSVSIHKLLVNRRLAKMKNVRFLRSARCQCRIRFAPYQKTNESAISLYKGESRGGIERSDLPLLSRSDSDWSCGFIRSPRKDSLWTVRQDKTAPKRTFWTNLLCGAVA